MTSLCYGRRSQGELDKKIYQERGCDIPGYGNDVGTSSKLGIGLELINAVRLMPSRIKFE